MPAEGDTTAVESARLTNVDELVQRLNDPQTAASLLNLLDNAGTLNGVLQILGGFFAHADHILENIAGSLREVAGVAAEQPAAESLPRVIKLGKQTLPLINQIADHDVLEKLSDPELLGLLTTLADGVKSAKTQIAAEPPRTLGPLKLLGELKDPDVSRGLDFALRVLKEVGRSV